MGTQFGQLINWIVLCVPVPVLAAVICYDARKLGRSRRACTAWLFASFIFPIVPIVYLVKRRRWKDNGKAGPGRLNPAADIK